MVRYRYIAREISIETAIDMDLAIATVLSTNIDINKDQEAGKKHRYRYMEIRRYKDI